MQFILSVLAAPLSTLFSEHRCTVENKLCGCCFSAVHQCSVRSTLNGAKVGDTSDKNGRRAILPELRDVPAWHKSMSQRPHSCYGNCRVAPAFIAHVSGINNFLQDE
ncbi:unnamed protein product [Ixodes pacificus]